VTAPRQDGDPITFGSIQHDLYTDSGRVYMTDITVGSPPTTYTVVIDTGYVIFLPYQLFLLRLSYPLTLLPD
jgi:hypothetical protein